MYCISLSGNWTQALKKVIESVYTYFSYDVNTYIASRLDYLKREGSSSASVKEQSRSSSEAQLTEIHKYACHGESEDGGELREQKSPVCSSEIHRKQQPPKLVSSFTVENILMGTQSSSSSPSSISSASPLSASAETSSSGNPATQPPVRYTKFTMVTPSSMAADKKKGPVDSTESRLGERASSNKSSSVPSGVKDKPFKGGNSSDKSPTTKIEEHAKSCLHIVDRRNGDRSHTSSPTSNSGINLVTSVIQSTGPSDHPKLCPVPEHASRTVSLHQSPLPQQFVVFFPANSTSLTKGLQTVVYANPQAVPLAVNQPLSPSITTSIMPDVHSPEQPPTAIVSPSSPPSSTVGTMPHINTTTTAGTSTCSEASFIPIAPKTEEIRHRMALRDSENMKLFHKRTIIKPKAPKPQKLPKPRKLRFHMTTVVKRAKRRASSSLASMTVPPPSLHTHHSSQGSHEKTSDDRGTSMESKIRSPQNFEATDSNQSDIIVSPDDSNSADNQSLSNDGTISPDPPEQPAVQSQTAVLKDSGFHLQVVKQSVSHPATTYRRGAKACGKRTYTKRKRELTFHLYEDPTTNFRVKRTCKRKLLDKRQ